MNWSNYSSRLDVLYTGKVQLWFSGGRWVLVEVELVDCPRCQHPVRDVPSHAGGPQWVRAIGTTINYKGFGKSTGTSPEVMTLAEAAKYGLPSQGEVWCECGQNHPNRPEGYPNGCGALITLKLESDS